MDKSSLTTVEYSTLFCITFLPLINHKIHKVNNHKTQNKKVNPIKKQIIITHPNSFISLFMSFCVQLLRTTFVFTSLATSSSSYIHVIVVIGLSHLNVSVPGPALHPSCLVNNRYLIMRSLRFRPSSPLLSLRRPN
jgi:hypothetical protein